MKARTTLINKRKQLELTQEELAKKVGISRSYLTNLELGCHTPSLEVAHKIAILLNSSLEELFL